MPNPLAAHLAPAARFLLERVCLCGHGPPDDASLPPPSVDELVTESRNQAIAGLLCQWAEQHSDHAGAAQIRQQLQPDQHDQAVHALKLLKQTLDAVAVLQKQGIEALVLKGPLLSKRYYGDYGIRHPGDVDLLVDESAVPAADQALRNAGYTRTKPVKPLTDRRLKLYLHTQHEFGYRPPEGPGLIELHWRYSDCRVFSPQSFRQIRDDSESVQVSSQTLRMPGPADTFAQLAVHGAMDGWSALKWIADLPRVYATLDSAARGRLHALAQDPHIGRVIQLALAMCGEADAAPTPWMTRALRHIQARMCPPAAPGILSRVEGHRYLLAIAPTAAARQSVLYANLITPRDFDLLPLPDALTPALPFLAQCRRGIQSFIPAGTARPTTPHL